MDGEWAAGNGRGAEEDGGLLLRLFWTAAIGWSRPPPPPELRRLPMLPERERTLISRDARERGLRERLLDVGGRLDELAVALCGAAGACAALAERLAGREEDMDGARGHRRMWLYPVTIVFCFSSSFTMSTVRSE